MKRDLRKLPSPNPYLGLPAMELSDHARLLEERILDRRRRTPEERLKLATDCALFLRAVYFALGRDPKWEGAFATAHTQRPQSGT